jgi:hypothetical protein
MTLLDTNVLLDITTADPVWLEWSENQIRSMALEGPKFVVQMFGAWTSEQDGLIRFPSGSGCVRVGALLQFAMGCSESSIV